MTDVDVPAGPNVAWMALEIGIRTCVELCGYEWESETADWVVADMKRRRFNVQTQGYDGWDDLSVGAVATVEWLKDSYRSLLGEWLLEAVRLECELWEAKIRHPGTAPARDLTVNTPRRPGAGAWQPPDETITR